MKMCEAKHQSYIFSFTQLVCVCVCVCLCVYKLTNTSDKKGLYPEGFLSDVSSILWGTYPQGS